ncbi:hypothetical protein, partial [Escherichia coli]|uniref:hypothetical protein n=1 Tax=Escherichia coli TaxID=562 RepID=UPI001BC8A4F8
GSAESSSKQTDTSFYQRKSGINLMNQHCLISACCTASLRNGEHEKQNHQGATGSFFIIRIYPQAY